MVKKALEGLDGIKEVSVSFKEKKADVLYDPSKVTVEDMLSAINSIGFRAKIIGGGDAGNSKNPSQGRGDGEKRLHHLNGMTRWHRIHPGGDGRNPKNRISG